MANSEYGKLFVGRIWSDTSEDSLREHFEQYGEVASSIIVKDRNSGGSKGFGFVVFADPSSADRVLEDRRRHVIDGRSVDVNRALPRGERHQISRNLHHSQSPQDNNGGGFGGSRKGRFGGDESEHRFMTKRIFVGGLKAGMTEKELKDSFERFGRIEDAVVIHDSATNRSRGFGFITFDSEEVVNSILQNNFYVVGGKRVEVKKAIPRQPSRIGNNKDSYPREQSRAGNNKDSYPKDNYQYPNTRYVNHYGGVEGYYCYGYYFGGYQYPTVGYCYSGVPCLGPWSDFGMYGTGFFPYPANAYYHHTSMNGGLDDAELVTTSSGIMDYGSSGKSDQEQDNNTNSQAERESTGDSSLVREQALPVSNSS
ncbi:hypothetical protein Dimus_027960 [Dionaea muscipula]